MKIGLVGLGRMGANIVRRLAADLYACAGFGVDTKKSTEVSAESKRIRAAASLGDLVDRLGSFGTFWVMVPFGDPTEAVIQERGGLRERGDVIIDGGNTHFEDDIRRADGLSPLGISHVDVGTTGGVWGLVRGFLHWGPSGCGHFVKMVHNAIEYGIMQAYSEGFELLKEAERLGLGFLFQVAEPAEFCRRVGIVPSWLLDLATESLARDPSLTSSSSMLKDTGEGRWAIDTALRLGVPASVINESVMTRSRSQSEDASSPRFLSALRKGFGGHEGGHE